MFNVFDLKPVKLDVNMFKIPVFSLLCIALSEERCCFITYTVKGENKRKKIPFQTFYFRFSVLIIKFTCKL